MPVNFSYFSLFFLFSLILGIGLLESRENIAKGASPAPSAHPSAKCWTRILFCRVPFEKFSWCNKSGDFRITGFEICTVSHSACVCDMQEKVLMNAILLV